MHKKAVYRTEMLVALDTLHYLNTGQQTTQQELAYIFLLVSYERIT